MSFSDITKRISNTTFRVVAKPVRGLEKGDGKIRNAGTSLKDHARYAAKHPGQAIASSADTLAKGANKTVAKPLLRLANAVSVAPTKYLFKKGKSAYVEHKVARKVDGEHAKTRFADSGYDARGMRDLPTPHARADFYFKDVDTSTLKSEVVGELQEAVAREVRHLMFLCVNPRMTTIDKSKAFQHLVALIGLKAAKVLLASAAVGAAAAHGVPIPHLAQEILAGQHEEHGLAAIGLSNDSSKAFVGAMLGWLVEDKVGKWFDESGIYEKMKELVRQGNQNGQFASNIKVLTKSLDSLQTVKENLKASLESKDGHEPLKNLGGHVGAIEKGLTIGRQKQDWAASEAAKAIDSDTLERVNGFVSSMFEQRGFGERPAIVVKDAKSYDTTAKSSERDLAIAEKRKELGSELRELKADAKSIQAEISGLKKVMSGHNAFMQRALKIVKKDPSTRSFEKNIQKFEERVAHEEKREKQNFYSIARTNYQGRRADAEEARKAFSTRKLEVLQGRLAINELQQQKLRNKEEPSAEIDEAISKRSAELSRLEEDLPTFEAAAKDATIAEQAGHDVLRSASIAPDSVVSRAAGAKVVKAERAWQKASSHAEKLGREATTFNNSPEWVYQLDPNAEVVQDRSLSYQQLGRLESVNVKQSMAFANLQNRRLGAEYLDIRYKIENAGSLEELKGLALEAWQNRYERIVDYKSKMPELEQQKRDAMVRQKQTSAFVSPQYAPSRIQERPGVLKFAGSLYRNTLVLNVPQWIAVGVYSGVQAKRADRATKKLIESVSTSYLSPEDVKDNNARKDKKFRFVWQTKPLVPDAA